MLSNKIIMNLSNLINEEVIEYAVSCACHRRTGKVQTGRSVVE